MISFELENVSEIPFTKLAFSTFLKVRGSLRVSFCMGECSVTDAEGNGELSGFFPLVLLTSISHVVRTLLY